jgi:dTMP kinase
MPRGLFFLFEGVDRCGKTTQAKRLAEALALSGERSELLRFPDRTTATGMIIDRYLQKQVELDDRTVHLLFSANRWEACAKIVNCLRSGMHVVVDRYAHSGVSFSSAKPGTGPAPFGPLSLDWCKAPDAGLPMPDVIFFMDIPVEKAAMRGGFGGERYEVPAFQETVRARFNSLKADVDTIGSAACDWITVDAAGTIEDIHSFILSRTRAAIEVEKRGDSPLRALWTGAEIPLS